ncbi:MAG: 3-keto-5-aminohexanoate cleavage protein [Alphaproteobacteria bacterium]
MMMNIEPFITCAINGSGATEEKHPNIPATPKEIADNVAAAVRAGAAICHIHARDQKTKKGIRGQEFYPQIIDEIKKHKIDVVLNFTSGMGGDIYFGSVEDPVPLSNMTDMVGPSERLKHVKQCLPEITTLDCGSLNFGDAHYITCHTPPMLRQMATILQKLNVKPELEIFDTGNLWLAKNMINEGIIDSPAMIQLCMGIPYGAPADITTMMAMVHQLPENSIWSGFAIARNQMPWVALTALAGGNVRVGLEDNIYLAKGQFASNEELVKRAKLLLETIGAKPMGPQAVRDKLKLKKQWG